jgi:hypothetical protein
MSYIEKAKETGGEILAGGTGTTHSPYARSLHRSQPPRRRRLKRILHPTHSDTHQQPPVRNHGERNLRTRADGEIVLHGLHKSFVFFSDGKRQVYVYDDAKYEETLQLIDQTTDYALTGAMYVTPLPHPFAIPSR